VGDEQQGKDQKDNTDPPPAATDEVDAAERKSRHNWPGNVLVREDTPPEPGMLGLDLVGGVFRKVRDNDQAGIGQRQQPVLWSMWKNRTLCLLRMSTINHLFSIEL
jgi:hypothetical protein